MVGWFKPGGIEAISDWSGQAICDIPPGSVPPRLHLVHPEKDINQYTAKIKIIIIAVFVLRVFINSSATSFSLSVCFLWTCNTTGLIQSFWKEGAVSLHHGCMESPLQLVPVFWVLK